MYFKSDSAGTSGVVNFVCKAFLISNFLKNKYHICNFVMTFFHIIYKFNNELCSY